jgi:hypothetical protein
MDHGPLVAETTTAAIAYMCPEAAVEYPQLAVRYLSGRPIVTVAVESPEEKSAESLFLAE